ncbi:hypothetical protein I4U23_029011 [Adineta vaga]|nr:hypothetical protein I4U23_029011 [Adineta vaga]
MINILHIFIGCKSTLLEVDSCNPNESIQIDLLASLEFSGNNQLKSILEQRQALNIKFIDITQANLTAIIPAKRDTFYNTGKRQLMLFGNDNISGYVTLFQSVTACRDLWLVHLTSEEYSAEILGAVHLLVTKQSIYIGIIVDMISHRVNGTYPIIQLKSSDTIKSVISTKIAFDYVYSINKNDLVLEKLNTCTTIME